MTKVYDKNEWEHWQDNLAGLEVPIHPSQPMRGFYARRTSKDQVPQAVALDYTPDDTLRCWINGKAVAYGLDVWMSCATHPIDFDAYQDVVAGKPWPQEILVKLDDGSVQSSMTGGKGHNVGADPATTLKGNITEWLDRAKALKKLGAPKTKDEADTLSDVATKLSEMGSEADLQRKAANEPYRVKVEEINAEWNAYSRPAIESSKELKALVGIWITAENDRRKEEAFKANEAARAKGATEDVVAVTPVRAGTRRTVSSVNRKVVKITDLKKVAEFLASMETPPKEWWDATNAVVYRLLAAGATVTGAELETKKGMR